MVELWKDLEPIARSNMPIILLGETGVGKSHLAKLIHTTHFADKDEKPEFVAVSSGELANDLADSTLFGHKKGAFTGATKDHTGFFELADKSTLFIDEVADLPMKTQVKLLTALDAEGRFYRVGDSVPHTSRPRIVVATNKEIPSPQFREDLYYRLEGHVVVIPPLRDRLEDIIALAEDFLDKHAQKMGDQRKFRLDDSAISKLLAYSWPGNIRELDKTIERSFVIHLSRDKESTVLTAADLRFQPTTRFAVQSSNLQETSNAHKRMLKEISLPEAEAMVERASQSLLTALGSVMHGNVSMKDLSRRTQIPVEELQGKIFAIRTEVEDKDGYKYDLSTRNAAMLQVAFEKYCGDHAVSNGLQTSLMTQFDHFKKAHEAYASAKAHGRVSF